MPAIIDKIAHALHLDKSKAVTPKADPSPAAKAAVGKPITAPGTGATTTTSSTTASTTATASPALDSTKVTVVFVLGGPGAGKGTQCAKLVEEFGFCHLSAGDLLREEQHREGSEYGELIRGCIKDGAIVPMEVTVKLLENAMTDALKAGRSREGWADGRGRFLIDGFPRKMDQAVKFEETVCKSALVLFFTTTEEVMLDRLLERGKTSGREDDNAESIKKRFVTYKETTMPVIEHFNKEGKVAEIDSSPAVDEVYAKTQEAVRKLYANQADHTATATV